MSDALKLITAVLFGLMLLFVAIVISYGSDWLESQAPYTRSNQLGRIERKLDMIIESDLFKVEVRR